MIKFLIKYHKLASIAIILSVVLCLVAIRGGININNTLEVWFVQDDKVYEEYIDFRDRYANDEVVAIYVNSGDFFNTHVLTRMVELCHQLDSIPFVHKVFSLANAPYIASTLMGPMVLSILPRAPETQAELDALRARVRAVPHYVNTMLDKEEKGFMVYVMLQPTIWERDSESKVGVVKDVAYKFFEDIHFGGIPVINESLNETARTESSKLALLSVTSVITLLLIFLRSWRYVLISVLSAVVPVVWLFTGFTLWNGAFNMVTIVVPTLLLITGTATSIHIVNICHRFYFSNNYSPLVALSKSLSYVFWPCFFTATTTMAGFASLVFSPINAIKEAGVLSAIGVGLVFICSFIVTAIAFLAFPPKRDVRSEQKQVLTNSTPAILSYIQKINEKLPSLAYLIFPLAILLSIVFAGKLQVGTHALNYISNSSLAYTDNAIIESNVGPFLPIELLVTSDSIITAQKLHILFQFQNALDSQNVVHNTFSPINLMAYISSTVNKTEQHSLPQGMGATEWIKKQYLSSRRNQFQKYDNETFTELRISGNTFIGSSRDYEVTSDSINALFQRIVQPHHHLNLSVRGYLPMYVAMNTHIIHGQIKTFTIAFFLILILIVICFRSVKLALIALLPNVFPISLVLIAMSLAGIPIDQSTALITCIILGVAFDDSIHLIYAYRNQLKQGSPNAIATQKALNTTASAMISTSIALFTGFVVIATASSAGLIYFGALCAIAVFGSLLGNIWLFPLLLSKKK